LLLDVASYKQNRVAPTIDQNDAVAVKLQKLQDSFLNVGETVTFAAPLNVDLSILVNTNTGLQVDIQRNDPSLKAKADEVTTQKIQEVVTEFATEAETEKQALIAQFGSEELVPAKNKNSRGEIRAKQTQAQIDKILAVIGDTEGTLSS